MAFDVTIKEYLKEIDEAPLLTWEDEKSLSQAVLENNDPYAREQLVQQPAAGGKYRQEIFRPRDDAG